MNAWNFDFQNICYYRFYHTFEINHKQICWVICIHSCQTYVKRFQFNFFKKFLKMVAIKQFLVAFFIFYSFLNVQSHIIIDIDPVELQSIGEVLVENEIFILRFAFDWTFCSWNNQRKKSEKMTINSYNCYSWSSCTPACVHTHSLTHINK